MVDYQGMVFEAYAGLEQEQRDLTEEHQRLLTKLENREIRTWEQLDVALREPYEAILGDAAGEITRKEFLALEQRAKRRLTPREAGIFLGWHIHVASYMEPKQVVGYFAGLLRNQENRPTY